MHRTRNEVAEATMALVTELPARHSKPTYGNMLIDVAKRLQRLQTRAKRLRKELKTTDRDIRRAKKELRVLAHEVGSGK
jgi:hypothetical protein